MKKQLMILLALPLLAAACTGSSNQQAEPSTPATANDTTVQANDIQSAQVDGVSGATNVANAPSFNGIIIMPPQNHVTLTLNIGGTVQAVNVLPGDHVRKGQVILTLANPAFIELQQAYLDAAAQLQLLDIDTDLLAREGIRAYLDIRTPRSGYVTNMDINTGKYYAAGEPVCDVIDKSAPMLQLTAYEKDLNKLAPGSRFTFKVNGMADSTFRAELVSVDQMVDNTNRSIKVYARIAHPHSDFRPGMYVTAKITDKKQ
ncbi:efflux RND transporter periplasmic adaptor subunit [uncultured Bacteroides sp.]|uniref:efflux RND transporter periplasmic adaptor subunit n=1 Tax=uncultured Bacteroides sp. TaxID=162156 RepID=UPI002639AB69|nr:efflux RND transporter periplasmic adaptor subunit [uncultured Bacteroides sp.]